MTPAAQVSAFCPKHPDRPAMAEPCPRCGTFFCAEDGKQLDTKWFCADCAVRPDVDYLEAYRLKYWGKRDGWAWLQGLGGFSMLLVAFAAAGDLARPGAANKLGALVALVVLLIWAVNGIAFFFGARWARYGVPILMLLLGVVMLIANGPSALVGLVIPLIMVAAMWTNTRNRLFFKLEVPRAKLQKDWDVFHNNTIARSSALMGVLGLLLPFGGPLAIIFGIVGLRRVNPNAFPPVGNKRHAIGGLVLGVLGTLEWVAIWVASSGRILQ